MKKIILPFIAFFLLGLGGLRAQESPTASGGDASGSGGSVAYSIGQVVYTTNTGTNGSMAQGVQQPYEISVNTGVNETAIKLEMSAYPNPTSNNLTLKTEEYANLSYQLYDLQGKLIENKRIAANSTIITMDALPSATYLLEITNNTQLVKTFKIIKNN